MIVLRQAKYLQSDGSHQSKVILVRQFEGEHLGPWTSYARDELLVAAFARTRGHAAIPHCGYGEPTSDRAP